MFCAHCQAGFTFHELLVALNIASVAVLGYAAMILWVWQTQGPDHWWNAAIIRSAFHQLGWCATPVQQATQPAAAAAVAKPPTPEQTPVTSQWSKEQSDDFYRRNGQGRWGLAPNR